MKSKSGRKYALATKNIVLMALVAAILSVGKIALAGIPNVEVVTITIFAFTYVFGPKITLPATFVFCTVETIIWGFAPWVLSYFVYWPVLAIAVFLNTKLIDKNNVLVPPILAFIMTLFFGVLTTLVDTIFYSGGKSFGKFFASMYVRGINFYLVHVVSNTIIVTLLFIPLTTLLKRLGKSYYGSVLKT